MSGPADGPPWTLWGAVAAAVAALWAALQAATSRGIARLEAELQHERTERERERREARETAERLGDRLDALRAAHAAEVKDLTERAARALMRGRAVPDTPAPWEEEAPAGVRDLLDIVTPSTRARIARAPRPR